MYSVIDYRVVVPSCDKLDESGLHDSTLTLSLLFSLGLTSIRFLVQRWPLSLNLLLLVCRKTWMQFLPFLREVRSASFESVWE